MHERNLPFKVAYAFNANCWTRCRGPSVLAQTAGRWHRGLIEILLYHRRCAFKPPLRHMGLVGIPIFSFSS
jgi:hypothetical protein